MSFANTVVILGLYLFNFCKCNDLYSDRVLNYDEETFKKNIGGSVPHFVNFYAPWCGYCKRLKPVWDELAEKYNVDSTVQKLAIAKVDCTSDTPLCAEENISGYPSLIYYPANEMKGEKYQGKRDLTGLEDFIYNHLGRKEKQPKVSSSKLASTAESVAFVLNDENFHNTIDKGLHFVKFYAPWCGHCMKMAHAWEELAEFSQNDKSVTISKIDCPANKKSCAEFDIKGFPTLLWIVNGKKIQKYQGGRNLMDFKRFIADMKAAHKDEIESEEEEKVPEETEKSDNIVVELSGANFDSAIAKDFSFVKFYMPWCGHSKRLAPVWNELAKKFVRSTEIKIAEVDCNQDEELCQKYKVVGYPTMLLFRNGEHVTEYVGPRKLEDLHNFLQDYLVHSEL
ncbi:thioredoxin domain-containing protein 5 homolog [Uloborus diversus]|uniref:thioredoxin domain-containing protein 5 homolog n=1 Tax=Uloborus diversus TaxID=327109 RepID=UPI00240A6AE3|nr:thioredoxin domain-containing protein 5 homolog [Uloborus diversus]